MSVKMLKAYFEVRGKNISDMNSKKAQNIIKCGVMPGEIDSIDLAEAKGYLQGRKDFAKELLDSLDTVDRSFLPILHETWKSIAKYEAEK